MGCFTGKDKEIRETEFEDVGEFGGFVLLDEPEWNKQQFLADFKSDWDIELEDETNADNPDDDIAVFAHVGKYTVMVGFTPVRVPNGEAEQFAELNYYWEEGVDAAKAHKATLIVGVKGDNENILEKAKLFVRVVATALNQKHATGYYDPGIVYEPSKYREFALAAYEDDILPVMNLVWFGMHIDRKQAGIYTFGMRRFGKEEMEVLIPKKKMEKISPGEMIEFLVDIAEYVLLGDVTFRDGETIGETEDEKHPITLSKGVGVEGNSFKIGYII